MPDASDAADSAIPHDIDRDELNRTIRELGSFRSATGFASSAADEAMEALGTLVGGLRGVAEMLHDKGVLDAATTERFVGDIAVTASSITLALTNRITGEYEEDDFGFDKAYTEAIMPLFGLLYDYWWRIETVGIENIPAEGRALLVGNHAGAGIAWDGAMLKTAIWRYHPQQRHLRMLAHDWVMGLPWVGDFFRKIGQTLACTENSIELLKRDELVGVFPEGIKGMMKPFSQRYQLQRFGRGGFVSVALRTGSPIIPVAIIGAEEIYPKLTNMPIIPKLVGAPFLPVTPTFPWLGLAGLIPLPSKWYIEVCEPIDVSQYGPEAAQDRRFVLELSEQIRGTIQQTLRANLLKRRTPFW